MVKRKLPSSFNDASGAPAVKQKPAGKDHETQAGPFFD